MNLIPQPVRVIESGGKLSFRGLPAVRFEQCVADVLAVFDEDMMRDFGAMAKTGAPLTCHRVEGMVREAYRLTIDSGGINCYASMKSGLWHGLQTLRQLLLSGRDEAGGDEFTIACAEIEDYPRFAWRGFMLDSSRHYFPPAFIKKLLAALSLHHINIFHWHLTDDQGWRLPVRGYPLLTEIGSRRCSHLLSGEYYGTFYNEAEIRDIVAFAAARHIEVVPEVDLPGHTGSALAAYPGLGCTGGPYRVEDRYGIMEEVLCAGNDDIFPLFDAIFDILAELFPSQYVHIGGDEVMYNRWDACCKCQRRLKETGLKTSQELQSWITVRLVEMLAKRGKTAIGWDEILDDTRHYPLPKDAIVMSWRGRDGGIAASRRGHRVIMTPNTEGCYLDYRHSDDPDEMGRLGISPLHRTYHMDAAASSMNAEEAALILGGQGNLWTEAVSSGKMAEYLTFPRISALAEALWSPTQAINLDDFGRRLTVHRRRLDALDILHYRGKL